MQNSFIFKRFYFDVFNTISNDDDALIFMRTISEYVLNDKEPDFSKVSQRYLNFINDSWQMIKPEIDIDIKNYALKMELK
jgi:hypothetical protein